MRAPTRVFLFGVVVCTLLPIFFIAPASAQPSSIQDSASTGSIENQIKQAEAAFELGEISAAIAHYLQILELDPTIPLRDEIYRKLGRAYLRMEDPAASVDILNKFMEEFSTSPDLELVLAELADAYLQLGDLDKASHSLERQRNLTDEPLEKISVTESLVEVLLEKQDRTGAIKNLLRADRWIENPETKELFKKRIRVIVQGSNLRVLHELTKKYPRSFPGDMALLRLADLDEENAFLFEAERDLNQFIESFPGHSAEKDIRKRLSAIKEQLLEHRFLIGVLLPMSERYRLYSEQVLNGIRLALSRIEAPVFSGTKERFIGLVIRDTEGSRDELADTIREMVREYKIVGMIGPLLSGDLGVVATQARRYKIPVITPSATIDIFPRGGGFLFRNALTLRDQGRFMAEYAMIELGLERFCILYPNEPYGRKLARIFRNTVVRMGGEVTAVESYPLEATDFGAEIKRIKEADLSRYGLIETVQVAVIKPLEKEGLGSDLLEGEPSEEPGKEFKEVVSYIPGFDAFYLPGDFDRVGLIASQLAFYDLEDLVLLGSNGWHSNDLIRIGGKYIEGGIFVDGFFPESLDPDVRNFVASYRQRYRAYPTMLSSQAFDSTMMMIEALESGMTRGVEIRDYIARADDRVDRPSRYSPKSKGELIGPLSVIQVIGRRFIQIK